MPAEHSVDKTHLNEACFHSLSNLTYKTLHNCKDYIKSDEGHKTFRRNGKDFHWTWLFRKWAVEANTAYALACDFGFEFQLFGLNASCNAELYITVPLSCKRTIWPLIFVLTFRRPFVIVIPLLTSLFCWCSFLFLIITTYYNKRPFKIFRFTLLFTN